MIDSGDNTAKIWCEDLKTSAIMWMKVMCPMRMVETVKWVALSGPTDRWGVEPCQDVPLPHHQGGRRP